MVGLVERTPVRWLPHAGYRYQGWLLPFCMAFLLFAAIPLKLTIWPVLAAVYLGVFLVAYRQNLYFLCRSWEAREALIAAWFGGESAPLLDHHMPQVMLQHLRRAPDPERQLLRCEALLASQRGEGFSTDLISLDAWTALGRGDLEGAKQLAEAALLSLPSTLRSPTLTTRSAALFELVDALAGEPPADLSPLERQALPLRWLWYDPVTCSALAWLYSRRSEADLARLWRERAKGRADLRPLLELAEVRRRARAGAAPGEPATKELALAGSGEAPAGPRGERVAPAFLGAVRLLHLCLGGGALWTASLGAYPAVGLIAQGLGLAHAWYTLTGQRLWSRAPRELRPLREASVHGLSLARSMLSLGVVFTFGWIAIELARMRRLAGGDPVSLAALALHGAVLAFYLYTGIVAAPPVRRAGDELEAPGDGASPPELEAGPGSEPLPRVPPQTE